MLNILEVNPRITGTPKLPLRRAADNLKQVAERAALQEAEDSRIRNRYISRVLPGATPPRPSVHHFKVAIESRLAANYGSNKGPVQSARNELSNLADRALRAGYPLNNRQFQDAFVDFLMAYVTVGFEGEDTTGTLIGNYKGYWPGGGFGE